MKKLFTLACLFAGINLVIASGKNFWTNQTTEQARTNGIANTKVNAARYAVLDLQSIKSYLQSAPMERSGSAPLVLDLPMPDGSFQQFGIVESPVMEPELQAKYPDIRTYAGQGITDPNATIRLDITQAGFHAMMLYPGESVFVDPYNFSTTSDFVIYNKSEAVNTRGGLECGYVPGETGALDAAMSAQRNANGGTIPSVLRSAGDTLRTYRLALACTGEYAQSFGGTPTIASTLGHMTTSVNRVVGVYEKELSIHMNLISKEDTLIFLNGATDPYTNNSGSTMLGENISVMMNRIGSGNYDIGHVFSTGGGGIAGLGVICAGSNQKARGVTGLPTPTGDGFDIDFVAHEMGHQSGGNHTFNGTTGSCNGNRNASTAYEPGSASTIMGYAGVCGSGDNLQPHSDPYFHTISFDEIRIYTTTGAGNGCAAKTPTGNNIPIITSIGTNYLIPKSTPFSITGTAIDLDLDPLTYCWEEMDLGNSGLPSSPMGNAPTLRSFNPETSGTRYFPSLTSQIKNISVMGEVLPSYTRNLQFRLTVRDNRSGGGGVIYDPTIITLAVDGNKGPFAVTQPNTNLSWPALSNQNVTWSVNGTDQAPMNTTNVNIYLSVDSGRTFPYTLATNIPNNGLASVTLPNVTSTRARVKVEAVGNIYFDMSNVNFNITTAIGINENWLSSESLNLYPNPSEGIFNLSWAGKFRGEIDLKVYDITGRIVHEQTINKNSDGILKDIDLTGVSKGIYTLTAFTSEGTVTRKIIIE